MMNLRKIKWWKAALMLAITVFFLYASAVMAKMMPHYYSNWVVNRWNVQERAYEALSLLSLTGISLIIFASCFIASLRSLIRCLFTPKKPSIFARLAARYGGYPTLISFAVFGVFLIIQLVLNNMIGSTFDAGEVPATLDYRIISCWIDIPLVLTFETTIVMFVSWIQNRLKKTGK